MDESLWGPLPRDKGCLSWRFGKTAIWVSDTEDEWEIASAPVDTDAGLSEETFPEDLTWTRYITTADDCVEVEPVLPDRPVVVRPASPIVILPGRWGRFFFRVPLWARFTSTGAGKRIPMTEVPSRRLASIWFGTIGSGELCYPIEAPLQRSVEQLEIDPAFATCEITVRNGSRERLQFERICVHVEYMRLYEFGSRLWTNEVRVVFRGSEQVSQLTFLPGPPSSAKDGTQVTDSRIPPESDLLKRSFALIREITGF